MKKLQILFLALVIFLQLPSAVIAQIESDSLQAYIAVSDKPDEKNPNRKTVREFVVGEMVYFAFAVSGMKRNSHNEVDLYALVKLITPEGKTLFSENKYARTKTFLPPEKKELYLSQSFDVGFDNTDSLGMYTLHLIVTDVISSQSASTQTTILLFSSHQAKELVMSRVNTAKHLDDLSALNFKTKNPLAVKRIISSISLKDAPNMEDSLVGRAAIWSLESNAIQHSDVYNICKHDLESTKGRTKELLSEIIKSVDNKKNK